jgi:acetylornithine/N-succinyldiaminopimelate aminotransferase
LEHHFTDKNLELAELGKKYIFDTYNRFPISLLNGNGMYLFDSNQKQYLDFVAGIAVNCLGHNDNGLNQTLLSQAENLIHCSNLYWNEPMINLAKTLVELSGLGKAFFCNSGAEAIEAALKLARIKGITTNGAHCTEFISMNKSFHGRTFGAISATGQPKYHEGFYPLLPGVKHINFNQIAELKAANNENTCAVLLEPIQGEGGIVEAQIEYIKQVRELCTEKGITLIFDEIQCGVGRTGKFFAFENYGIKPDIVVLAKGLAGGFPIGAMLANDETAKYFKPGNHASTFGGNPLACHVSNYIVSEVVKLLDNIKVGGIYLKESLNKLASKYENLILECRGFGYMQGIEFKFPVKNLIAHLIGKGILTVSAGDNVLRIVPPLICTIKELDVFLFELESYLSNYEN